MANKKKAMLFALNPGEELPNAELVAIHQALIKLVFDLNESLGTARTVDEVDLILLEISEVNHRVSLVGKLLFRRQTDKIVEAAEAVKDAIKQTKAAIAEAENFKAYAEQLASFLGLVDKVIDMVKIVTPV